MKIDATTGRGTAVIVVAGGSGARMGAGTPKQFIELCGKPILAHTVGRLRGMLPEAAIIVALPAAHMALWDDICMRLDLRGTHTVCAGGATRFESVKNALGTVSGCGLIAVHDGVRPLFTETMVRGVLETAMAHGSAVPVVEIVDSLRRVAPDGSSQAVDRSLLRAVQTPQAFSSEIITEAYGKALGEAFTDDASVVESAGYGVTLCAGERRNIKITTPEDMAVAGAWMETVI